MVFFSFENKKKKHKRPMAGFQPSLFRMSYHFYDSKGNRQSYKVATVGASFEDCVQDLERRIGRNVIIEDHDNGTKIDAFTSTVLLEHVRLNYDYWLKKEKAANAKAEHDKKVARFRSKIGKGLRVKPVTKLTDTDWEKIR